MPSFGSCGPINIIAPTSTSNNKANNSSFIAKRLSAPKAQSIKPQKANQSKQTTISSV